MNFDTSVTTEVTSPLWNLLTTHKEDMKCPAMGDSKGIVVSIKNLLLDCVGESIHYCLALFILSHAEHITDTHSIRVSL